MPAQQATTSSCSTPNEPPLLVLFAQVIVPRDAEQAAALVAVLQTLPCLVPSDVKATAVCELSPSAERSRAASCPSGQATHADAVKRGGSAEGGRCWEADGAVRNASGRPRGEAGAKELVCSQQELRSSHSTITRRLRARRPRKLFTSTRERHDGMMTVMLGPDR